MIIKQNSKYKLVDVRGTQFTSSYQIIELATEDYPEDRCCGVYSSKRKATNDFTKLSK